MNDDEKLILRSVDLIAAVILTIFLPKLMFYLHDGLTGSISLDGRNIFVLIALAISIPGLSCYIGRVENAELSKVLKLEILNGFSAGVCIIVSCFVALVDLVFMLLIWTSLIAECLTELVRLFQ